MESLCDANTTLTHGANFNAIVNVFGKEYLERTVTCQWHFRKCANRQIAKVNKLERESFKNLVNAICYSNTVNDYNNVSNALDKICECNKITNWFKWWKEHKYHIVPAYREVLLKVDLIWQKQDKVQLRRNRPM